MKLFLLAALLAAASLGARGQTYYLDLTSQALTLSDNTLGVEKVVDGRAGQLPIGIVYRGLNRKSAAVAFRQGLETELTRFLQFQLPVRASGGHTVVLCVRTLHIGEIMGGKKEQAIAELTADVYEHLPDGYHFVRSTGAHASAYGYETTGLHAGHLAELLSQCLSQAAGASWAAGPRPPARTLAQLPADAPAAAGGAGRGAAILRETPRRGLYYQFEHFLTNRPDTVSSFFVDTIRRRYKSPLATARWRPVARVRPLAGSAAHPGSVPPDLWGFSDGRQVFVRYDKQFFPLMRQGGFFTFVGEAPEDQLYAAAQAQAQAHAGMIAGVVGAAVTHVRVPDHSAEPMAYGLEMRTGAIAPYPGAQTSVRADTAYVYVYRPVQAAGTPSLKVYVDGREMGTLGAGQYLELPWARFGKPLQLCLGNWPAAKPCQFVVPNAMRLNYLKVNEPTALQPWQWMTPTQGAADLDELDKRAR